VTLLLISFLIFASGALLVLTGMRMIGQRDRVRRRLGGLSAGGISTGDGAPPQLGIDAARLGLSPTAQRILRVELIRAGFFEASAVVTFTLSRGALLVLLPLAGYAAGVALLPVFGLAEQVALIVTLLAIAHYLPGAFLSRRRRSLEVRYRQTFPDFLDMLVVCINAGLSLEAALQRAARELGRGDAEFRINLDLMADEMRAGKSTGEALRALADRLCLREAASFAALLQQTIELGTDLTQALTVFSDEMRDKRMARAEEKAAALPPKLTLPLGLFIFPVVLIAVLAPAVLRIMHVIAH
jgi:tight adherence protein C